MATLKVWDSKINNAAQSLELPEGRYAADFGFLVEQSVNPDYVLGAAQSIIESGESVTVASQAKLMVLAQEKGLAFTDWASRLVSV